MLPRVLFQFSKRLLILFAGLIAINASSPGLFWEKKRIVIEPGSKVYIKGTSNVNSFTCHCDDQYPGQTFDIEKNGGAARFRNIDLRIQSRHFDCHNRKIDNDMQKALKADIHPYIRVALVDAWLDVKCLNGKCPGWFDVQAKVNLSITNTTKTQIIAVKARHLGANRIQIQGETALQMSAYGIEPPTAMFGMIKVNDWISIHFDMFVTVENVQ